MSSGQPFCQLTVNTDISGIGVRVSFYVQTLLLVLLGDRSWQDAPSALWTFIATSFGLTVSAISQARSGALSFFQALQVTNLVWLANFGAFLALASFSRHRRHEKASGETKKRKNKKQDKKQLRAMFHALTANTMKIAATCQTLFTMALTMFTWARPNAFPQLAQLVEKASNGTIIVLDSEVCQTVNVTYVAFFDVDFNAEKSGRKLGLAMSGILMAVYLYITANELYSYLLHKSRTRHGAEASADTDLELGPVSADKVVPEVVVTEPPAQPLADQYGITELPAREASASGSSFGHASMNPSNRTLPSQLSLPIPPQSPTPSTKQDRPRRPKPPQHFPDVDPMFLGISVASIVVLIYFVSVTELLNVRNPVADANQWAFGQILALILVVPSLVSVIQAFREHGIGRIHHRLKKNITRRARRMRNRGGSSATQNSQA
ncbi:hypothetical protein NM688_g2588 [Phlebia brevispora]|uniref:Uncharacterized protein n=1 Tax=Phlebia brevispora TaxID=194682 RepID=A0ACC1T8V6_9APHY|nr:hypothetical protein NM688_g2588 [Phlebia brevispora]